MGRGTLNYVPCFGDRSIAQSANELLWERFGYGPAAIQMLVAGGRVDADRRFHHLVELSAVFRHHPPSGIDYQTPFGMHEG